MPASDWVSYVVAATGITGAVMTWINLRRTAQLKALDLRLEVRKADADVRSAFADLPTLFEKARRSRAAVTAATGQTGAQMQWLRDADADRAALQPLQATLPAAPDDYRSLTPAGLEDKLVELHRLQSKVKLLSEKYQASLAADDKVREQLQANMRDRGPQGGDRR
jgi:hypothetical protein